MGQKVNPKSLRLKISETWDSAWFSGQKSYSSFVIEDFVIRKKVFEKFKAAGLSKVVIERSSGKIIVTIFTSKPGVIIGRQGAQIDEVRKEFEKEFGNIDLVIKEVKKVDIDARLIADNVARQIEKRVAFKRAAKQAISKAMKAGAKGIKIKLGGRLNGVEIARKEIFKDGNIPLHTFRSIIDYSEERSKTIYGVIGVKVWVYKGDHFAKKNTA